MVLNIIENGQDVDNRAKNAEQDFRGSKFSVCTKEYPEVGGFPVPLQKLLAVELEAVEERILAGKPTPVFEQHLKCNCRFARRYFLPCRHIFHLDGEDKVLTPPVWKSYVDLFEEGGFEVYETMGWVDVEERLAVQESIKTRSVLVLREIEERLRQQLYTVWEIMEEEGTGTEEQQEVVTSWMDHVHSSVEPLTHTAPEEIVHRGTRPWELLNKLY